MSKPEPPWIQVKVETSDGREWVLLATEQESIDDFLGGRLGVRTFIDPTNGKFVPAWWDFDRPPAVMRVGVVTNKPEVRDEQA